jgi:molecular chaperone HtpG
MGQPVPRTKRILEINPTHPLITALHAAHSAQAGDETQHPAHAPALEQSAELLYGLALLAEGGELEDPARFSRLIADRLAPTV